MQKAHWGFIALAALLIAGGAEAKDPAKKESAAKTEAQAAGTDQDGLKPIRAKIKPLRNEVLAARRIADDKAEALALCKLAAIYTRIEDRTEAAELLLRASMLARRLEDADLGNKVTRQIRDLW
ncbi:MAG: hypothetical protein QM758_11345 [Armatimonas sp.]